MLSSGLDPAVAPRNSQQQWLPAQDWIHKHRCGYFRKINKQKRLPMSTLAVRFLEWLEGLKWRVGGSH